MEDFRDTIGDNNNEILNNNYIGNNTNDDDEAGRTAVFCWTLTRARHRTLTFVGTSSSN